MTPRVPAETVCIVGLGLLGGSLARALHALPERPRILATDRDPDAVSRAVAAGVLDVGSHDAPGLVAEADLVVYATPLRATLHLIGEHRGRWREDGLVTDLVSLKAPVQARISEVGAQALFVGGHPMTGGTGTGFVASRADLFGGARVWLTPGEAPRERFDRAVALWRALGAEPLRTDAEGHDRMMAWSSHLPQLLSNALAGALDSRELTPAALGPGGRDMVRLAASPSTLWRELLEPAREDAADAVSSVARALDALAGMLRAGDIDGVVRFMDRTRRWRGEE